MWDALTLVQRIYFCIACPASVFLVAQIVLMLIGLGGNADIGAEGVDLDGDGIPDVSVDTDSGLSLFTVKGLTAFFTIGGWVGFTLGDGNKALAIIMSLVAGTIALVLMAFVMKWLTKIQSNGNINFNEAIGKVAEVYLTIPPDGDGEGKITLTIGERLTEFDAIQKGQEAIKTGSKVKVISVVDNTYVVEKI